MSHLPVKTFIHAMTLFAEKRWSLPGNTNHPTASEAGDEACFERFCDMLSRLPSEQRDLVLRLTSDFLCCPMGSYSRMLTEVLHAIPADAFKESKRILLVPLLAPKDFGRTKSGQTVVYTAHALATSVPAFSRKPIVPVNDPRELAANHSHSKRCKSAIIMCDDFIGTGNTAKEALDYYVRKLRKEDDSLAVVCLVVQKPGLAVARGVAPVYYHTLRHKGISESTILTDHDQAKRTMLEIEKRLSIKPDLSLGYGQSEALVSMIRTPNNTLPVFWATQEVSGQLWPSPFPRYPTCKHTN